MFSRKIDNPLTITLDYERLGRKESEHNYFTNCDPVAGFVTLSLTKPQEVGQLIIRFYGTSKSYRKVPGSEGPTVGTAQPWLFNFDLSPPEINSVLEPGTHIWYFDSAFPFLTNPYLVQDEEEKFNVSEEGFEHDKHPLPPSCKLKTGHTSGLDTSTNIWYAIDTEFTKIGGKPRKLMAPSTLYLDYVPMATEDFLEPSIKTIHTTDVLECRSVALNPRLSSISEPGKSVSWRDRIQAKIDKDSTPLHTFQLELMALDQYTIDKPMSVWLRVIHDPDGKSSFSHDKPPPVYILEASVKHWTWNHVRGTSKRPFGAWKEGDVEDPVCWSDIIYSYKSDRKEKNNDDDPTNDVFAPPVIDTSTGMGTDLTKLGGIDYMWGRSAQTVPDFSTYNVQTRQAIEVNVEIMVGGKKFDVAYQRQKYKWEKWLELKKVDCLPLVSGCRERQHKLRGELMEGRDGDMQWWLDGDERERYTFKPQSK